ncbi:MAG: RnfABCDGE type electron transport complex subunit B [Treponema sp.]|nr:RnfABCDGE type electron transport complex subunit B [Treponema sp.]
MMIVLLTAVFALVLAFILGLALGFFKQFFEVAEDPLVSEIRAVLPGANCGACGFPGCDGYASAIAAKKTGISGCPVGGSKTAQKLSALVGGEADVKPKAAVIACRGTTEAAAKRGEYIGVKTCRAAKIATGSIKACTWGCQGFGDCVTVCQFGALSMGSSGLPVVDYKKCTGCRACAIECPQHIIRIIPAEQSGAIPLCSNLNVQKNQVLKNCKNGCIKCELCIKNCPQQCMKMANGIPSVDYSRCTDCGICVEKCPTKVMKLIQRDVYQK